jgi:hypothetical protein
VFTVYTVLCFYIRVFAEKIATLCYTPYWKFATHATQPTKAQNATQPADPATPKTTQRTPRHVRTYGQDAVKRLLAQLVIRDLRPLSTIARQNGLVSYAAAVRRAGLQGIFAAFAWPLDRPRIYGEETRDQTAAAVAPY